MLEVAGVPVFYWPTLATDLEKPSYYIDNIRVRNDSIFGTQLLLEFDAFQLFGLEPVPGVEWDLNLDYLSERGPGLRHWRRIRPRQLLQLERPHHRPRRCVGHQRRRPR